MLSTSAPVAAEYAPHFGEAVAATHVEPRAVGFVYTGAGADRNGHDARTKRGVARSIAELLEVEFVADLELAHAAPSGMLFVPSDTIENLEDARKLGIRGVDNVFGGVVPHPFVATKIITHPLVHADAHAPGGWSNAFGEAVAQVVLPGYSVFTAEDALRAGNLLLEGGTVRVKEPGGVGGGGQYLVRDLSELKARIAATDPDALRLDGLVLERNLNGVTTHSVGQVRIGRWLASYCGTQHTTRNQRGHEVYGGSRLTVVRGDHDALLDLELNDAQRVAVKQALQYHRSALACFPGLIASRANYDIAQGTDDLGAECSGVLEQSWRIGGASGAELAALHAFRADAALRVVRAATHEVYGEDVLVPMGASVNFDGVDSRAGRLIKYATVESYVDT